MNADIAIQIIDGRMHLSMLDLHAQLSELLSKEQLDELYVRLFIPVNLNTATEAEFLLIPGVGSRMLREFKEYRPYKDIGQFRREIGKYVTEDEVARFERYVT
jgi:hypothetical protein